MLIEDAVSSGTPQFVIDSYATLAERAKTQSFGLIEEDVIVLDTETTGLSVQDNELIEISAARLSGREVVDRFDTFVHPKQLIPAEITELTSITNADVADAPSAVEAVAALADFVGGCPVIAHNVDVRPLVYRVGQRRRQRERYLDRFAGAVAHRASAPGIAQVVFYGRSVWL